MKGNTLYQPSKVNYPFVDLLWVDEELGRSASTSTNAPPPPISTIQCSVSDTHDKYLQVYERLRKSLDMPDDQLLIVYLATVPRCVGGCYDDRFFREWIGRRFFVEGAHMKLKSANVRLRDWCWDDTAFDRSVLGSSNLVDGMVKTTSAKQRAGENSQETRRTRLPTIGSDFYSGRMTFDSQDAVVNLQMWDTPGRVRFSVKRQARKKYEAILSPDFFRQADAIMLVYDMTSSTSFTQLLKW